MTVDISVNISGLTFKNPIIVASGSRTASAKHILKCFENGAAGAVTKTMTFDVMQQVQPKPRMHVVNPEDALRGRFYSLYSIELMSEHSPEKWVKEIGEIKGAVKRNGGILIASIAGRNFEEWEKLARLVEDAGADMIEINLSCPHIEEGALMGRAASSNLNVVSQVVRIVKNAASLPVIGKLTPHGANPINLAKTMFSSGADAVVSTARFQGLIIDVGSMKPILWGGYGGYGGPWQLPISLGWTAHIARENVGKPIIGSGGISGWEDIARFLLVGASAVQICTAIIIGGYSIIPKILKGFTGWMEAKGFQRINEFIGLSLKDIIPLENLERRRIYAVSVDLDKCTGCGVCELVCPYEAISLDDRGKAVIGLECGNCGLCASICPFRALSLKVRAS
ncbi:4Fe-4S binding protein [Candidatus Bathyarchaeota archaeon]|nr:4Fe-4S binding protein [Candidatus Bathyarchaeota archaeon]